ncbi:MAG: class I SAM-dependent methyltransferase [Syntrophobacterales bacterium]|nr:class I SAM-dependent methyltransferase [Syntrophobacterales bacterium]
MDIGSASSYIPVELAKQGHQVVAVDIRPYPLTHKNLTFISGDITASHFGFDLLPFDVITCVSTLEHIGVGYYGGNREAAGDQLAVATMHRLLKPGGALLLTVPFAATFSQDNFQRIYDFAQIGRLFETGWRLREERFHIPKGKKNWIIANREEVLKRHPEYPESNNAAFWLEKV